MTSYAWSGNLTLDFQACALACRKIFVRGDIWRGPRLGLTPSNFRWLSQVIARAELLWFQGVYFVGVT
jgi:hypothetical protein